MKLSDCELVKWAANSLYFSC